MSDLERQVIRAQHRLWFDRWLSQVTWCLVLATAAFAAVVLVQRLYALSLPVFWGGIGLAVAAVLASIFWMAATREDRETAAAKLDEAAGLRERISSGLYCATSEDPFARAVAQDADAFSRRVSVRVHLPLRVPRGLGYAGVMGVVAALMFLITPGALQKTEAKEAKVEQQHVQEAEVVVKKRLQSLRKRVETNPVLKDLKDEMAELDDEPLGKFHKPSDLRHEAMSKIDRVAEAVKRKRAESKYDATREVERRMRALKAPNDNAPTEKLAKALARGDFKSAREEMQKLQEQLATLKSKKDEAMVKQLNNQLRKLGQQVAKLSGEKKLDDMMKKAGVDKKQDQERLLASLKKKDMAQVQKQLQQQGMNKKQAQQQAKKMMQQQQACGMCKGLGQALSKAGTPKQGQNGQPGKQGQQQSGQQQGQKQGQQGQPQGQQSGGQKGGQQAGQKGGQSGQKGASQQGQAGQGQQGQAGAQGGQMAGMQQAEQQLSDMEQMQQEMQQLESTLQAMQQERDNISKNCSKCNGTGKQADGKPCSKCGGSGMKPGNGQGKSQNPGGGMGRMGSGKGGIAPEQSANVDFKVHRQKVQTTKGAIIGQIEFEGEQVKGNVSSEFVEIINSAERYASDAVNRDRVPRQYHDSIKEYFANVRRTKKLEGKDDGEGKAGAKSGGGEGKDDAQSGDDAKSGNGESSGEKKSSAKDGED